MSNVCVLSIDYTEGQPETYRGVHLHDRDDDEEASRTWDSGDAITDWDAAKQFAFDNYLVVLASSTVFQFFYESGEFELIEQ